MIGVDADAQQLAGATRYVEAEGLANVQVLQRDAYDTGLPAASFDLVHVRFVFAPVGRDEGQCAYDQRQGRHPHCRSERAARHAACDQGKRIDMNDRPSHSRVVHAADRTAHD